MIALRDVLSPDLLLDQVRARYPGLVQTTTWGERVLFYNPGNALPRGIHFLSLKERDSAHDTASHLDATGSYRVSFALTEARYETLFGAPPQSATAPSGAGRRDDRLTPHPVFAWLAWAAIVNPTGVTLEELWPVLDESFALARTKHEARVAGPVR